MHRNTAALLTVTTLSCAAALYAGGQDAARGGGAPPSVYVPWKNGPSTDPGYFPIGVWLQDPRRAAQFQKAGINLYVGLWRGPTEEQLSALKRAGMRVICDQNAVGLKHLDDPTVAAWMHNDEPDNAQPKPGGGYGDPIHPSKIIADYGKIKAADPTRPVFLNLGQGVANDEWKGRGNNPQDYREYVKGADVLSFDVYPVVGINKKDGENYLWYVPKGIDRLKEWSGGRKLVWNILECTRIDRPDKKATPDQVKAQVWMSLIHGSRGIVYFIHQFKPNFVEAALLEDPAMLAAVTALNGQIKELAPVLNSPTVADAAAVTTSDAAVPIDIMAKRQGGTTYVFAVGMRNARARGSFRLKNPGQARLVTVIGENRTLELKGGQFEDAFGPYAVHLYRIEGAG